MLLHNTRNNGRIQGADDRLASPPTACYIGTHMSREVRHITAQLLLAAYLLAGGLLEFAHHDGHAVLLRSQPVVSSHDCGAREVHIPLDQKPNCLACTQASQRFLVEAAGYAGTVSPLIYLSHPPQFRQEPLETDILYSGKRGPPIS